MRRRYVILLTAAVFATGVIGTALAGGSSDTSGDGFHCYLFFEDGGFFAQAMMNDAKQDEVIKKRDEFIVKYTIDEGLTLATEIGNLDPGAGVCEAGPSVCSEEDILLCEGRTRFCSIGGVCQVVCSAVSSEDGCEVRKCAACKARL